jgi:hypothetical protein
VGVLAFRGNVSIVVAVNPIERWKLFAATAEPAASNESFTLAGVAAVVVEVDDVESVSVVTP